MRYDPVTGNYAVRLATPEEYREHYGSVAWLYDPWTGNKRDLRDVGTDPLGKLIVQPFAVFEKNVAAEPEYEAGCPHMPKCKVDSVLSQCAVKRLMDERTKLGAESKPVIELRDDVTIQELESKVARQTSVIRMLEAALGRQYKGELKVFTDMKYAKDAEIRQLRVRLAKQACESAMHRRWYSEALKQKQWLCKRLESYGIPNPNHTDTLMTAEAWEIMASLESYQDALIRANKCER
jgi:hypothetical protein